MGEPIEALAAIIAKVAALHQPQPIYGECFHAPGYGCTPVEAPWIDACDRSIEGWYCRECCTVNDVYLRTDCPHGWDHAACTAISACSTMDALTGSEAGDRSLAEPPVECGHDVVEFYPGNRVPPYGWETEPGWYCTTCGEQVNRDEAT